MLMTKIIKGIPVPDKPTGRPRKYDIPLDKMSVGDHVKINVENEIDKEAKVIRNFVGRYVKRNPNRQYTVRTLDNGVGIWRVA
tara:strand:- start:350 stop:598 length:249 start_codon:yes stop_codon:yes gene_type:complete